MALLDMVGELTGVIQGLAPPLAQRYINRALRAICDEREWNFLLTDGAIICPAQVIAGSVSITQYNADVTLDAVASAAIATQLAPGATPGILQLQFRVNGTPPMAGPIYSIIDFDDTIPSAVVLTMDRVITEATNPTAGYAIYRCYVKPPIPDFLRFESLVDVANAFTFTGNRLTATSVMFDLWDPQRSSTGLAYWLGAWGGNRLNDARTATIPNSTADASTPIYELWPHPTTGQSFYCRFRRTGTDNELVNPSDTLPQAISENLVMQRVYYEHVYPFCAANLANFPSLKNANWLILIQTARMNYSKELLDAKKTDMQQALSTSDVWNRGHGLRSGWGAFGRYDVPGYPIDSNFIQSHLLRI